VAQTKAPATRSIRFVVFIARVVLGVGEWGGTKLQQRAGVVILRAEGLAQDEPGPAAGRGPAR